jgi:hypothetical protein
MLTEEGFYILISFMVIAAFVRTFFIQWNAPALIGGFFFMFSTGVFPTWAIKGKSAHESAG